MTSGAETPDSGLVIWITGRPSSGKTTLARHLIAALRAEEKAVLWLDSDDLRSVLTPQADYTEDERDRLYDAIAHLAELGVSGGALVLVSATASKRIYRDQLRARVDRFIEVWLDCDETTLRQRDAKGLYAASDRGEVRSLPGVGVPFEAPLQPELTLRAGSPEELCAQVLQYLRSVEPQQH